MKIVYYVINFFKKNVDFFFNVYNIYFLCVF